MEAADQSEVSLWSRDPLSANHSSPAAPGLDVLALRGLAAPGAGVPHVGRVAVLQHTGNDIQYTDLHINVDNSSLQVCILPRERDLTWQNIWSCSW